MRQPARTDCLLLTKQTTSLKRVYAQSYGFLLIFASAVLEAVLAWALAGSTFKPDCSIVIIFLVPMPLTRSARSCSESKGPPRWRSSRINSAVRGPIPLICCNCWTSAAFRSTAPAKPNGPHKHTRKQKPQGRPPPASQTVQTTWGYRQKFQVK